MPEEIQELPPLPITHTPDNTQHPTPHAKSLLERLLTRSIPPLSTLQKYSSISFTVFSLIHGTAVLITPAISTSLAEQLISMGRSIYHSPGVEELLVWGSLGVHVLSGTLLRCVRNALFRMRHGERKKKRVQKGLRSGASGEVEVTNEEMGLVGGVSGYAGLPKKSFIFRKLGLTPLQFSGYLSIPLVLFHVLQMRLVPLWCEGDSSYVSLEYVMYVFRDSSALWRPVLNWVVYPALIVLTTYHTVYGWLTWLRVRDLKLRKLAVNAISLVSLVGLWSLYTVSRMEAHIPGFLAKKYDGYLNALYLST